MEKLNQDFREFIGLLEKHAVEYLIVGGYAVAYTGFPVTPEISIFSWRYPKATRRDCWLSLRNLDLAISASRKLIFNNRISSLKLGVNLEKSRFLLELTVLRLRNAGSMGLR